MARSRPACRPGLRCSAARPWGSPCNVSGSAYLMPQPVERCSRRFTMGRTVAEVALIEVSKRFGAIEAVRALSLAVADGEFVVLLGPTGAGKTTTLRLIAGLERPDRGSVCIAGRPVTRDPPGTRDIAFIFQQYSLHPHLTVFGNL